MPSLRSTLDGRGIHFDTTAPGEVIGVVSHSRKAASVARLAVVDLNSSGPSLRTRFSSSSYTKRRRGWSLPAKKGHCFAKRHCLTFRMMSWTTGSLKRMYSPATLTSSPPWLSWLRPAARAASGARP